MRNWQEMFMQRHVYLSVLLVLALSLAASTSVIVGPNSESGVSRINVAPGDVQGNDVLAMNFTVEDGGDTVINGSVDVGEELSTFEENSTMFLNTSHDSPRGSNGYNIGEDILNVSVVHSGEEMNVLSGEEISEFSSDTLYADGGNLSNGRFEGGNSSVPSELVLRDNGSEADILDREDYVVVNGTVNASNFSDAVLYSDQNQDDYFDNGSDAIIRNHEMGDRSTLENQDTVLRSGSGLKEFGGAGYEIRFADSSNNNDYFEDGNAVVKETDTPGVLEEVDEVIVNGEARVIDVSSSNLTFFDTVDSQDEFEIDGEPIYHEGVEDGFVNVSNDTRIGTVTVTSVNDSDPTTVDLDLETMEYINSSASAPETNEVGKTLYNVSGDSYPGEGQFWAFEFDDNGVSADGVWNPGDSGDQEILVYDLDSGSDISRGETLIYNSDPSNDNVSIGVGEEFGDDIPSPSNSYQVDSKLGYMDDGTGSFEISGDNVSANISSSSSNWAIVNLAPSEFSGTLGGSGTFTQNDAVIRFWNASGGTSSDAVADGLYVDVDNSSNVTHGDVRVGEWIKTHEGGVVENNDLDIGAPVSGFLEDKAAFLDEDDSGTYSPGDGTKSGLSGREAIISNTDQDEELDRHDAIIREGLADLVEFNGRSPEITYYDADNSGSFEEGEAIVQNSGTDMFRLEDDDRILTNGEAGLTEFNASERYIENGETSGFEKGSNESIIYDRNFDGILENGSLEKGSSADHVIVAGTANLESFTGLPGKENESGLAFVDRDMNREFNYAEDIINITLVTNGSDSSTLDGKEIRNFARTTKHNGSEVYKDGNAIVNDTDDNSVFADILESLEVGNTVTGSNKLNHTHIMGEELELFRDGDGDHSFERSEDERVASLSEAGSTQWSVSGISENITSDTTFFLTFNSSSNIPYDIYVDLKAEIQSVGLRGGESLSGDKESPQVQRIDAYPPELDAAITGYETGGNNTEQDTVRLVFDEQGSLLSGTSIDYDDFNINSKDLQIVDAYLSPSSSKQVVLELNSTFSTNATPEINHTGDVADNAGNPVSNGEKVVSEDGIKPEITRVRYQDTNADARIDEVDVFFTENISYDSFEAGDWDITYNNIPHFTVSEGNISNSNILELNASALANITGVESSEPELNFTQQSNIIYDSRGNSLDSVNNIELLDDAGPAIVGAKTSDPDSDSRVEKIHLNFSENLDDSASTINASVFNVTDGKVLSADSVNADDNKVELTVEGFGTSAAPNITLQQGYIYDKHENTVVTDQKFASTKDNAKPVLLHAEIDARESSPDYTIVSIKFGELVKDNISDKEGVNMSGKQLEFLNTGLSIEHKVNFSEPLQTGDMPNITALENITDDEGNKIAFRGNRENITVNSFRKQVNEGWNFVSFPIADETTPEIEKTINTSRINVIWTYRNSEWQIYDPKAEKNDFEVFEGGAGYLLDANTSFTLNPNVNTVRTEYTGRDLLDATHQIDNGFNLIGTFQENIVRADSTGAFGALDPNSVGAVYEQSIEGKRQLDPIRNTDGSNAGEMMPGEGYWMFWDGEDSTSYKEPEINSPGEPSASATVNATSAKPDETVEFDASSSNSGESTISSYEWELGDGSTETGKVIEHSYSSPGEYTVELTVEDDNGLKDTYTIDVNIGASDFEVSITGDNTPITEGETFETDYTVDNTGDIEDTQDIELRIEDFGSVDTETVSLDSGGSATGTLNWSTSSGDTGSYNYNISTQNDNASSSVTVDTLTGPTASASANTTTLVTGETVELNGSSSTSGDASIDTYRWDVDEDGSYEYNGETVTHAYSSTGSYDVELNVTDENSISNIDTVSIDVSEPETAGSTLTGNVSASPGWEDVKVEIVDGEDNIVETLYTDENGEYAVNIPEGQYTVEAAGVTAENVDIREGTQLNFDLNGEVVMNGTQVVNSFDALEVTGCEVNGSTTGTHYPSINGVKRVSTIEQLQCISEDLDEKYILTQNINASETESWNGGKGFRPVPLDVEAKGPFEGELDGDGNVVHGLYVNRDYTRLGLMSSVNSNGTIKDIGLNNTHIKYTGTSGGDVGFGTLAGINEGTIVASYSINANVTGSDNVGGLVGANSGNRSVVKSTYVSGNISGEGINGGVGGLVGGNLGGNVSNSYAIADVEGEESVSGGVGAIVGKQDLDRDLLVDSAVMKNSYYVQSSEVIEGGTLVDKALGYNDLGRLEKVQSLEKVQMQGASAFDNMIHLDFNNNWKTVDGSYPEIRKETRNEEVSDTERLGLSQTTSVSSDTYVEFNWGGDSSTADIRIFEKGGLDESRTIDVGEKVRILGFSDLKYDMVEITVQDIYEDPEYSYAAKLDVGTVEPNVEGLGLGKTTSILGNSYVEFDRWESDGSPQRAYIKAFSDLGDDDERWINKGETADISGWSDVGSNVLNLTVLDIYEDPEDGYAVDLVAEEG